MVWFPKPLKTKRVSLDWLRDSTPKTHVIVHHSATEDGTTHDTSAIDTYHRSFRKNWNSKVKPVDNQTDNIVYYRYNGNWYKYDEIVSFYREIGKPIGSSFTGYINNNYYETAWSKLGYNLVAELVGSEMRLFYGRSLKEVGSHCYQENMNKDGIGLLLVGNYDMIEPSEMKWKFLLEVCRDIRFVFPSIIFKKHSEVLGVTKTCCGTKFDMNKFRSQL